MSQRVTPKLKECARRLLDLETPSGEGRGANNSPAFRVCEKLRSPLGKMLGAGGFHSLLARALALAAAEIPWLREMPIMADGTLQGLDLLEVKLDARLVAEGEVILVAQLLGLLVTFIGPALTLRFLHDVWPTMDDLNF